MAWVTFPKSEPVLQNTEKAANVLHSRESIYASDEVFASSQKKRAIHLGLFHSKVIHHFLLFIPFIPQSAINKLIGFFRHVREF